MRRLLDYIKHNLAADLSMAENPPKLSLNRSGRVAVETIELDKG
jgi:hypothetical protein